MFLTFSFLSGNSFTFYGRKQVWTQFDEQFRAMENELLWDIQVNMYIQEIISLNTKIGPHLKNLSVDFSD